jgi:protein-S-isoprenylcysteine O-methyltransferase Ste14
MVRRWTRASSPSSSRWDGPTELASRVTFAWLVGATSVSVAALGPVWSHTLVVAGGSLALAGTVVNVWAIRVVGLDTYYYRDLFSGDSPAELTAAGPYRFFRNPMYGVGQAAAYGLALVALSPAGLLATLLNQLTMYAFNEVVEQPHLAEHRR